MQTAISLTGQLRLYAGGQKELGDPLLREILPRLRQIAVRRLGREYRASISPTELIGETWVTGLHHGRWTIESREHFFSLVGRAMENVLIDMARRRKAQCRGNGAVHLSLSEIVPSQQPSTADAEQILAIGMLIERLEAADPSVAFVVRMHYIVGFSLQEIASETGLSLRQVRHRWEKGKLWLATRLTSRRR